MTLASVDGEPVTPFYGADECDCFPILDLDKAPMGTLLRKQGLLFSYTDSGVASAYGMTVAVACSPPDNYV